MQATLTSAFGLAQSMLLYLSNKFVGTNEREVFKMTLTQYGRRLGLEPSRSFYDYPEAFSERTGDFPALSWRERGAGLPTAWHPSADVYEDDGDVFVQMDLPGMKKEEIDISFDGHILSITGRRKEDESIDAAAYWSRERYFGEFHRYVHIPAEVTSDDPKANYEDGALVVTLHKVEAAKRKKITVESGHN